MFKYVQIVYALSPRDPDCLHWPLICQDLLMDPWTLYKAISLHPDPRIKTLSGWVKVTKVTETWECCSFEFRMIQGTRQKLLSLDAAVSPRQGDDGYIIAHRFIMINRYHISHALWKVLKTVPEDPGLCSNMFKLSMPFSPRDPDCLHWPLICQDLLMDPWTLYKAISLHPDPRIKTLSGWVKVTKMTETWECCSFEFWMIQGTRQKLPSLDAAVSPRQGDDGYRVDPPYHISQIPFPRFWRLRLFQKIPAYVQIVHALSPRDPNCSHWPLICQDLLMDPWTLYKAISLHPDPRIRTLSGWVKVTKVTEFGSVAQSNFGWNEVLVENCHFLMQLSCHVKVMMDT